MLAVYQVGKLGFVPSELIRQGVIDQDDNRDKVFRLATRAMRYSASLADLLWVKINQERERVGTSLFVLSSLV